MPINTNYYEFTENAIKNKSNSVGNKITEFKIKKGQTVKFGLFLYSKPTQSTTFTIYNNEGDSLGSFANFQTYTLNVKFERTYTATEDTEIYIRMWGNADSEIFEFQLWAELDELTNYLKYEEQNYILDIQQEMLKEDYFELEEDGWKEVHGWNKIESYNGENITTEYISTTGELTTGATIFYKTNLYKLACTEEQSAILDKLNNLDLFKNTNNIITTEDIALLKLKYVADTKTYIDNQINERLSNIENQIVNLSGGN